jgi:ABC-type arginine/histidine transport system permease subunit
MREPRSAVNFGKLAILIHNCAASINMLRSQFNVVSSGAIEETRHVGKAKGHLKNVNIMIIIIRKH